MVMTRSDGPVTSGHRSTQRHPGNGSCGSYILITVGTTDFDELIGAGSDEAFVQLAHKLGFDEIRLQIGRGAVPANPVFVLDSDHNVTSRQGELQEGGVRCTYYRLKQTLLEEIRNASLVVTHAGAGTIMESLLLDRPVIVASNPTLMGNHQIELASQVEKFRYGKHIKSPTALYNVVEQCWDVGTTRLRETVPSPSEWKRRTNNLFDAYLRQAVQVDGHDDVKKQTSMFVLGSGGHTAEMFRLIRSLDRDVFANVHYVVAKGDTTSEKKAVAFEMKDKHSGAISGDVNLADCRSDGATSYDIVSGSNAQRTTSLHLIPRSRKVKQSYFTSIFTTLFALCHAFILVWTILPDVVVVNGPGTCIPIVIIVALLRLLRVKRDVRLIYVESVARVSSLSLSGRIVYTLGIADGFVVQWEELKHLLEKKHPRRSAVTFLGDVVV
eukprot:TRINITY_DN1544_c0_g1_i1.p1 TRINITY_DN1544_c0_g1~~TRINITY_DN1544_c0_g1_i1.p1  ORF type:complete len:440 (+),score=79.49 TRINITY_DN1544_c0_g1_i1:215-1534(+)